MQSLAEEKEIRVTLTLSEEAGLCIEADPQRLKQIVGNLLSNAIKFTPAGGHVALTLHPTSAGQALNSQSLPVAGVHLEVQDSGAGIPTADLPHIFERFYRGSNATTAAIHGTGLGLYLSRELTLAHQGFIWADNHSCSGASFHLWLPSTLSSSGNEGDKKRN
jgi:signal transduction histidine kinase